MLLIKAFLLCMVKHWKQRDKAGKRYIWHPIHVMLNVEGYNEKIKIHNSERYRKSYKI